MDTQSYRFQLTINHPLEHNYTHKTIFSILSDNFRTLEYACLADEKGSTYHTHVFVSFSSRVRLSMLKRYFPEAHIEICKGTVTENVNYIKKCGKKAACEDKQSQIIAGTFEEIGKQPPDSRGKRHDMTELYQMIEEGLTNAEILARNQDYILYIDKIDRVRTTILTDTFKDKFRMNLQVIYISGPTGCGKTWDVLTQNGASNVYRVTDYKNPFDGYSCQPIIFFDEFYSSLKMHDMLNYCGIYSTELHSRYMNKWACYEKVYIASNWPLERQYRELQETNEEIWKSFLRRISKVIVYDGNGGKTVYESVEEYFQ